MAKGNYTALQQLKPAEIKVGELYNKWVDGYIKNGEAERAAKLKRAQEEGKSLQELMKDVKIDYSTTITPFQNESNRIVSEGIDFVGNAKMMATNMNIPIEERRAYAQKALNYSKEISELNTFLKDPKMAEVYAKNVQTVAEGKAFKGDQRLGLYTSVEAGVSKFRRNKDGMLEVGYIEDPNDPEKKEKWELFSQAKQKYMTPIEESTVESYNKYLVDLAQKVTTKTTESNGYVKIIKKEFDAKDAKILLMTSFGLDPSKDAKDNFNVNNIPRQLNHRFYDKHQRTIQSADDLKEAINDSVLTMKTAADKEKLREVLKTADDITLDKLQIANARKNFYKQDAPSAENSPLGSGTLSVGNVVLNIKTKGKDGKTTFNNHYQTQGLSYYVSGNTNEGKASKIGVTTYWNPNGGNNGKGGFSYAMNIPSKDGKEVVIEGVGAERAKQILASNKVKDPQNVLAMMATMAEQNNLAGLKPKGIGRGFGNYNVDFSTDKKTETPTP